MSTALYISHQLGGTNRIALMTGAKTFVNLGEGLRIKMPRNKFVDITYDAGRDLFDCKFARFNSKTLEINVKKETKGLYVDQLRTWFENATGLYLSL